MSAINSLDETSRWWTVPWIPVGHAKVCSLWHCFGVLDERVNHATAETMLAESGTNLLPINTNKLDNANSVDALVIGHGDVSWPSFEARARESDLLPCLNINLQTTARDAIDRAHRAHDLSGINLLKLEVLNTDLRSSNDAQLIAATDALRHDFVVMPLVSADIGAAREATEMEVPLLRVMGSPIGSCGGVQQPDAFEAIVSLGCPIILDGGIGSVQHLLEAIALGAAGGLINSLLFRGGDPAAALHRFVSELASMAPAAPLARLGVA